MKHTLVTKHPAMLLGSWHEFWCLAERTNDDKPPIFLIGWTLGHRDADIITLMQDGIVRCAGLWKYSPTHDTDAIDASTLNGARSEMKNTEAKVPGCMACEHGISFDRGRKHTVECRETVHPTSVLLRACGPCDSTLTVGHSRKQMRTMREALLARHARDPFTNERWKNARNQTTLMIMMPQRD